jgi:hypothetical protein
MADTTVVGYDIVGDVHGCSDQLEDLLIQLGYEDAGHFRHPTRQAIFVGDLIDRGDGQLRVLQIVKAMVDAGSAQIVMGNHEFNALAYHHEYPPGSGNHLRAHHDPNSSWPEKNTEQHRAFLDQVTGEDRRHYLDWFATMPLWLDLGELRIVHACWHEDSMAVVLRHCGTDTPFTDADHLAAANSKEHPLHDAIENLLKGPEISLVEHGQPEYKDKDGAVRGSARIRWWSSEAKTLRDIAEMSSRFKTTSDEDYPPLPDVVLPDGSQQFVYTGGVPVFYGHYWRQGSPAPDDDFTGSTACVDFSAVKPGGALTAYRWSGESTVERDNYVQVR